MDEYLGFIKLFTGNFAPVGWLQCNGQLLQISQYEALYSLLGTTYGGDGNSTFALPDLQNRVPAGASNTLAIGSKTGSANVMAVGQGTLSEANLPPHTHSAAAVINVNNAAGTSSDPTGNLLGSSGPATDKEYNNGDPTGTMSQGAVTVHVESTGSGAPFAVQTNIDVMQPTMGLMYIICVNGYYPQHP